jgi:hypothetical protein
MTDSLPSEIEVTELADGVRYRLPRRKLGTLALAGVLPLIFGLVFMGIPLTIIVLLVSGIMPIGDFSGAIFFGLFIVPFLLVGAGACYLGLMLLFGRAEIELSDGRLTASERMGPFCWSSSRRAEELQRLVLLGIYENEPRNPASSIALRADSGGGRSMQLANAYPLDWLTALATDLSRRWAVLLGKEKVLYVVEEIKRRVPGSDPDIVVGYTPVVGEPSKERPVASDVVIEEDAGGVTLTVPPPGMRRGYLTVLIIGLVLSSGVVTVAALIFTTAGKVDWGGMLCGLPVALLFEMIGIVMVVASIDASRRRAILAVAGGKLLVLTVGPFGTKRLEWSAAELATVRVGPSGTVINGVPVPELQVYPKQGSKKGFLNGRDEPELEWIAGKLRQALGLASTEASGASNGPGCSGLT